MTKTTKSNIFIASLIWLILAFSFVSLRIIGNAGWLSWLGNAEDFVLSFVVQIVIMLGLSVLLFSAFKKQSIKTTFSDFSFKKIGFHAIWISILIGIIVFVLNIFVSNFFSFILSMIGYEPVTSSQTASAIPLWTFLLTVLTGCIFPAICEEVSHRGLLIKGFEGLGVKKIILLSGLFFGFMHFDISKFGYAFAIGCLLAYITLLTRSLYPAMIIHFMNNFMVNYVNFSTSNDLPFGRTFDSFLSSLGNTDLFSSFLGILLLVFGLGILLYVLIIMLFKQTSLRNLKLVTEELALKQIRNDFLRDAGIDVPAETTKSEETIAMEKEVMIEGKVKNIVIKIPASVFGIKIYQKQKMNPLDKVFLFTCIFLGSIITVLTFFFSFI